MSTITLFARNIARQSFAKAVRLNTAASHVGAVRFGSTYFTPGKWSAVSTENVHTMTRDLFLMKFCLFVLFDSSRIRQGRWKCRHMRHY